MINEIKTIVQNYLDHSKLTNMTVGIVNDSGIKVSDKLTLPLELVNGNLKEFITNGDKVRVIRNLGGQEFYIAEIIGKPNVLKGLTLTIDPITVGETIISSIKIKDVVK